MKKTSLARALAVAGIFAMAGAAQATLLDDALSLHSDSGSSQTWFHPDGSSHTVNLAQDSSMPDTTELGAGPLLVDDDSTAVAQTWFFPDGSSRSETLAAAEPMITGPDTTELGAGPATLPDDRPLQRSSSQTFDSPQRAGEASTMTNGVPNMLTDNPSD